MTNFLIKHFIKGTDVKDLKVRNQYAMLSSFTGIAVNILLSISKLIIGFLSNSMSIISDAINNVTDAGSSIVTMIGFKISQKQVDKDHPWGHGRMEYIAAFIVDMIILLVGVELLKGSVGRIITPTLPEITNVTMLVLFLAIAVKLWLFFFYRKIARKIDSTAIKGVAYDSISDVLSTTAVLISALVARFSGISIDGYISLLVSIFILYTGIKAIKETIDLLLGQKPDPEFVKEIEEFVKQYATITGIHDIMIHDYGPGRKIVSFHAEVPANSDICKAHDVIDKIEQDMLKTFHSITTIHMDPIVTDNEEVTKMREFTDRIVKEINPDFSIHDFRMTDGGEHINLIFDLVIPLDCQINKEELKKEIAQKIHKQNAKYYAVPNIEHSYI